jgi:hypothetical protein
MDESVNDEDSIRLVTCNVLPSHDDEDGDDAIRVAAPRISLVSPLNSQIDRRGRVRAGPVTGDFWALLVSNRHDVHASCGSSLATEGVVACSKEISGVVNLSWSLRNLDNLDAVHGHASIGVEARRSVAKCLGYLQYHASEFVPLTTPISIPADFDLSESMAPVRMRCMVQDTILENGSTTLHFLRARGMTSPPFVSLAFDPTNLAGTCVGEMRLVRSLQVTERMGSADVVEAHPTRSALRGWRQTQIAASKADMTANAELRAIFKTLLELPAHHTPSAGATNFGNKPTRLRKQHDPLRLVAALAFSRHLRTPKAFSEAKCDAMDYAAFGGDEEHAPRSSENDPSRTSLEVSRARLDVVSMLQQRRQFTLAAEQDTIRGIAVYSDASPVVGAELQGMIADVMYKDNSVERTTLPGSTLAYGHTDAVAKTMALVWAIFLVAGPTLKVMRYFFDHITSLTTDFGVEMHLLELPDVLVAFLKWVGGAPLAGLGPDVVHSRRLMWRALRIAGWSHTLGGIMKASATECPNWPDILQQLRYLCQFFRNESYRAHLTKVLSRRIPGLTRLLANFTATFAKWRYETLANVCRQLNRLRVLCEEHFVEGIFENVQDKSLLDNVIVACRNKGLWKWISMGDKILFGPLENIRRWGMVCNCCVEKRRAARGFVFCEWSSRRLRDAWGFIQEQISSMLTLADTLTMGMVDGCNETALLSRELLRFFAAPSRWLHLVNLNSINCFPLITFALDALLVNAITFVFDDFHVQIQIQCIFNHKLKCNLLNFHVVEINM